MSRTRRLRWYQQLRWKLPANYLLLALAPIVVMVSASSVVNYFEFESNYTPATFVRLAAAKGSSAGALLASPPTSRAAASLLLDEVNDQLLTRGDRDPRSDLSNVSDASVASAIVDRTGMVIAAAPEGFAPAGSEISGPGAALVAAALDGEADPSRVSARAPDGSLLGAVSARDESGRVVGAIYTRVYAPYSVGRHAQHVLSILWGPLSTYLLFAVAFAAAFGLLAARSVVSRFEQISAAAANWGRGDLSVTIDDRSRDEIGQLAATLNGMANQLRGVVALRQELATLEERNRLARDLHDSVKQQVFALAMQLGAARATLEGDRSSVDSRLDEAEKLARSVQQELVALIRELQPPDRAGRPFPEVLREYVGDWARQAGIAAEVRVDRPEPLPPATEHAFFRVAQEALANVLRHSGATKVVVELTGGGPTTAVLSVADNGVGFDPASRGRGLGLANMRERAEELPGGRFSVAAADGGGTKIEVACSTDGPRQRR